MTIAEGIALAVATFALGALGRHFLAGYLTEKGRNLATKEDTHEILRQLEQTTKTTEEIKSQISSDLWLRQRVWDFKREVYCGLLQQLAAIRQSAFHAWLIAKKPASQITAHDTPILQEHIERLETAIRELRKLTAVGSMLLSSAALEAIRKFDLETHPTDMARNMRNIMEYAHKATDQLVVESRSDLQL